MGAEWLRTWAEAENDVALDNSAIACAHGALDPSSIPGESVPVRHADLIGFQRGSESWGPARVRVVGVVAGL